MKIAIIGTGIAGNLAAARLHPQHEITVFEQASRAGGHTHTHDIVVGAERHAIDTGFIVFNHHTYPQFTALLDELGVPPQETSMSFSVRNERSGTEYNGTDLNGLFAQRRNLLRPSFLRMLAQIMRFNREAPRQLETAPAADDPTLGEYLASHGYGRHFIEDYLLPMGAAVWSTAPDRMLEFPARFFVRFFANHGMLSVNDRPVWRTVQGGSARYVERLIAPFRDRIRLDSPVQWIRRLPDRVLVKARDLEAQAYDQVFMACHADEALALLADPSQLETEVLGAIPYQQNEAVLHTDAALLPRSKRAWAAWNYHALRPGQPVTLTYNMNILQRLKSQHTFCVTLNRSDQIDPSKILRRIVYDHPLFTPNGVAAQSHQRSLNAARTYYCGAYWGFGFHEDGVVSSLAALRHFEENTHAQCPVSGVA